MQHCAEPELRAPAPALAAASDRYTVAWMRPAKEGGALLVQQFARDTLKPLGAPRVIVERDDLRDGGVELVAIDGGYLVTSRIQDPEKSPNWATRLLTARLDRNGALVGDETTFFAMDYACPGAGVIDDRVAMAYVWIARSHHYPRDVLGVLAVDSDGGYRGSRVIEASPMACASAVHGREIAIAWTRWGGEPGRRVAELGIAFDGPLRDDRSERFNVPVGDVDAGPLRVAWYRDTWALLYADRDKHLHVAFVDRSGTLVEARPLPQDIAIDNDSVDLAPNARGLFITWVDGGRVRARGINGAPRVVETAGSAPSTTRALGDAASCVVAWTVDGGKRGRIAKAADCP